MNFSRCKNCRHWTWSICVTCLVVISSSFGYWLAVVDDHSHPGNTAAQGLENNVVANCTSLKPRGPKREGGPHAQAGIHGFNWHYQSLLKDIDNHVFRFDQKRQMPVLRQEATETSQEFRVRAGLAWLRTQSLVVAATVRNAMPGMLNSIKNFDRLRALFNRSWVVMVENDSSDQTREYLHDLSKRDPSIRLLGCGTINSRTPCRSAVKYRSGVVHKPGWGLWRKFEDSVDRSLIMSALRNQYLEYTYDHLVPLGATLLMIIDADMSWFPWDLDNITQGIYYFMAKPKLQQLCSNTRGPIWKKHEVYDPWSLTFYNNKHFGEERVLNYENTLRNATLDLPPVKVATCFQAMSFYRLSDMAAGRFMYGGAPDEWNCEHNTLSRKLSEVYIDPHMRFDIDSMFVG